MWFYSVATMEECNIYRKINRFWELFICVCVCVCVVGLENEMMMSMTRDGLCQYNIYLLYIYLQSWLLPLPI